MPVNGSTIVHEVVGDMDLEVVTPVGLDEVSVSKMIEGRRSGTLQVDLIRLLLREMTHKDSRPRDGAVEGQTTASNPIRSAVATLDRQPVLASDAGVRERGVVVGVDVIVPPAAARSGSVLTTGGGVLARTKNVLSWLVQTNDVRRGGT